MRNRIFNPLVCITGIIALFLLGSLSCHHRLEVIEQTIWQEIMKEVFKDFGLKFGGC